MRDARSFEHVSFARRESWVYWAEQLGERPEWLETYPYVDALEWNLGEAGVDHAAVYERLDLIDYLEALVAFGGLGKPCPHPEKIEHYSSRIHLPGEKNTLL